MTRRARDRDNRDEPAPPDDRLVIVLNNCDEEIERGMAPAGEAALGVALMMLVRGREPRPRDTLRVLAPS
jgi:hypothetical protein